MTNPPLLFSDILGDSNEEEKRKKATASTGQLFSDIAPSSPSHIIPNKPIQDQVDSPLVQLAKSFAQGAIELPKNSTNLISNLYDKTLGKVPGMEGSQAQMFSNIAKSAADKLSKASTSLEPNVDPNHPIASAIAQSIGTTSGQTASNMAAFGIARAGINTAIDMLPNALVSNANKAIASVASDLGMSLEKILPSWAAPSGSVAKILASVPKNVATAYLAGAGSGQDPMQSLAFGFLGAANEAGFGLKGYDSNASQVGVIQKPQLAPHSQRIQDQLASQSDLRADDWSSLMDKIKDTPTQLRQGLVDKTARIRQVENDIRTDGKTPAADAARLAAGIPGKVKTFLEDQPFAGYDPTGNPLFIDSPSIKDIFKNVGKDGMDELNRTAIAARVLDERVSSQYSGGVKGINAPGNRTMQGPGLPLADNIETGINPVDARLELANAKPGIIQATTQLTDNLNAALNYAVNRGRLDPKIVDLWRQVGESYIPLNRVFDSPDPMSQPGKLNNSRNFKKLQGSEELIGKPSETVPDYISRTIRGADMNYIWNNLVDAARQNPIDSEKWMNQIEAGNTSNSPAIMAKANSLMSTFNKANPNSPITLQQSLGLATSFHDDVFDAQSNVLTLYNNGALEKWRVHPDIARSVAAFNPSDSEISNNILVKMFQVPSSIVKTGMQAGITKNPAFAVFHGIADSFLAKLNTTYGFEFGKSSLDGFGEAVKKGEEYKKFMASGGGGGVFSDYNSKYSLESLQPKNGLDKVVSTITHPLEALGKIAQPIYTAAKLGEFMKGTASGISSQQAALSARNVTPDMGQVGGSMKFLSSIDAFLNPAIQHFDNFYQGLKERPKQILTTGVAGITLPTIALWFANRNDQQINDMRKGPNGSNYWYIRIQDGDNGVARIKKPYLPGFVFGTLAEQALDEMVAKDPHVLDQAGNALGHEFGFSFIPQSVQLAAGLWANKDYYSGSRIIPQGLDNVDPSQQKLPSTSPLASTITDGLRSVSGGHINVSPINMDYAIRGATGDIGVDISRLVGIKKDANGPSLSPAQWPVIGKFIAAYPTKSVEPLSTFYKHADQVDEVTRTMKNLEAKNPLALSDYIRQNQNILAISPMYTESKAQIGKLNQELTTILNLPDKTVSRDYKKQLSDYYIKTMITIARNINDASGSTGLVR